MRIHKEGHAFVAILLIILLVANMLLFTVIPAGPVLTRLFIIFSGLVFFFILWFFRVPDRSFLIDNNLIIAPADGMVVAVEETREDEYFNDSRLQVSIFMSPLNVHVNYYPIGGVVKYYKYHPGDYLVAWHPKASTRNERSTIVIDNGSPEVVLVRQIAGALARRIVCFAKTGEHADQGQELGFIKFGSRVDLLLPPDVNVRVRPGDKVTGQISVIASFNQEVGSV
jgi:phosphatidylserine decarboxylase